MESVTKTPRKQLAKLKFCFTGNVQVCVWLCDAFNFRDFCRCFPLRILMLAIFPTINRRKWFSMSSSVRKMVFYNKTKKRNTKEYVLCITRDEYKKSLVIGFFPPIFVFVRSNGWCGCVCVSFPNMSIFSIRRIANELIMNLKSSINCVRFHWNFSRIWAEIW